MSDGLATALGWGICVIAICSYLAVDSWNKAREREREAYYRSEAIKKIAEMQGVTPEPVLQVLRDALATGKGNEAPSPWAGASPMKAYYRAETIKKIAEMQGAGATGLTEFLREEDRVRARRTREGLKLSGMIVTGVGIALVVFLRLMILDVPVYLAGLFPLLVGLAMLTYGFVLAPKE